VDRFGVESTLGIGGMATVYRVRHRDLETVHALKIPADPTEARISQLRREGWIQARVRHPNVVAVTDLIDVDGVPGLLLEYVGGPTLEELLRVTPLPRFEVDLLVPGLLAGVGALHDEGIVHRDLKPGNVMLARRRRRVIPKLIDFGMAHSPRFVERRPAARDFGTPHYMAPEMIRDPDRADPRLDIYALGAVLYELATGRRAFPSDDPAVVVEAARRGHVVPVRRLAPDLPERMASAIERALSPDPACRPATCAELWRLWAGPEAPPLGRAPRPALQWRGTWLAELERIGPPAELGPSALEWSSSSTGWVRPAPIRASRPGSPALLLGAALAGIGLVAAGALLASTVFGDAPWPLTTADDRGGETSLRPAPHPAGR